MTKATVVAFRGPRGFSPDPLADSLRQGARQLIAQAVEAELNTFPAAHADQTDSAGRRRLALARPPARARGSDRDRCCAGIASAGAAPGAAGRAAAVHFDDPAALSAARQIHRGIAAMALLKGISTGDFSDALAALLRPVTPAVIGQHRPDPHRAGPYEIPQKLAGVGGGPGFAVADEDPGRVARSMPTNFWRRAFGGKTVPRTVF